MTTNELREAFQRFYEERGHLRVPGALADPARRTTSRRSSSVAGMQQFKPYFLRTKEPPSHRVVSVQPCLRAGGKDTDLEEVGRTERHCSFFEMMGNFSFGDYFKDEAVDFAWEWVTGVLGLEPERLWATVHEGDPVLELGEDTVAIEAWQRVGIPPERIVRLGKDNFWQAGEIGPVRAVLGDLLRPRRAATPAATRTAARATATDTWRSTTSSSWSTTCSPATCSSTLPTPERRHGHGPRAHGVRAAGRRLGLRHRRLPR